SPPPRTEGIAGCSGICPRLITKALYPCSIFLLFSRFLEHRLIVHSIRHLRARTPPTFGLGMSVYRLDELRVLNKTGGEGPPRPEHAAPLSVRKRWTRLAFVSRATLVGRPAGPK